MPSGLRLLPAASASVLTVTSVTSAPVTLSSPWPRLTFTVPGLEGSENLMVLETSSARAPSGSINARVGANRRERERWNDFILRFCVEEGAETPLPPASFALISWLGCGKSELSEGHFRGFAHGAIRRFV